VKCATPGFNIQVKNSFAIMEMTALKIRNTNAKYTDFKHNNFEHLEHNSSVDCLHKNK
jgi:hypothetical protein